MQQGQHPNTFNAFQKSSRSFCETASRFIRMSSWKTAIDNHDACQGRIRLFSQPSNLPSNFTEATVVNNELNSLIEL